MSKDLAELLARLDDETRLRWERYLESIEEEIADRGPAAVRSHLDRALEHVLAAGWVLHRCYVADEASDLLRPLGEAASTIEDLRAALDELVKKPEWSQ